MLVQIINNSKQSFNQIQSTSENMFSDMRKHNWDIKDCTVVELKPALLETKYRSADGKNYISNKQYLGRAKATGKLNKKQETVQAVAV
jgi:hypothetical protein